MLDPRVHDYTAKEVFNKNFFKDWRKVMTEKEKDVIRYGVLTFYIFMYEIIVGQ